MAHQMELSIFVDARLFTTFSAHVDFATILPRQALSFIWSSESSMQINEML